MTRDEYDRYRGDVFYDVWRSGGNPDCIDYDRVRDSYYDGLSADGAADRELHAQRRRHEPEQEYEPFPEEQPYPEQEYPEEPPA